MRSESAAELHRQRAMELLDLPEEELFTVQEVEVSLPRRAQLRNSVVCAAAASR